MEGVRERGEREREREGGFMGKGEENEGLERE